MKEHKRDTQIEFNKKKYLSRVRSNKIFHIHQATTKIYSICSLFAILGIKKNYRMSIFPSKLLQIYLACLRGIAY